MKSLNLIVSVMLVHCGFLLLYVPATQALETSGAQVAFELQTLYNDTPVNCGSPSMPGFLCSGLIFRATIPSPAYKSWAPSGPAIASGGFSFSYLRVDSEFKRLVRDENNGFIIFPPLYAPVGKQKVSVLCMFPVDGATNIRNENGCGVAQGATSNSDLCHRQGIYTAQQWYDKRVADNFSNVNQCGFNVRDEADEKATSSFNESIKAMSLDATRSLNQQNEMRLATTSWDASKPATLPIRAFFYLPGGLADAQYDQKEYFAAANVLVPVIAMTLPGSRAEDATFTFSADDQAIKMADPLDGYIKYARWIKRYDPGSKKEEWSLSVVPTDKGREARAESTEAVYAELLKRYGDDPRWVNNDGGGMRRQLVCHLVISRYKPEWNMEPFRPNVSHDSAVAAGCNPI
ncbi:hypothetical protein J2W43_003073 [Pseudomonas brassicacearum]|uniref:DUF2599 domain-containing protein n=1 Tax=Pseudomonas brassicacearum TaxID=930166 RepID=A0AAW8MAL6_9PSED|nr:DUF2599 domain-containing protein [Pseudomonas brassicacearum]MDR6959086.1 hypothetical protein [Pseudomonas brassicacearum]